MIRSLQTDVAANCPAAAVFLAAVVFGNQLAAQAAPNSRYLAVLADGTRVQGETISDWYGGPARPRLDRTELANRNRPLRWLRDMTLAAWEPVGPSGGFVELLGGDRLPGKIVGFVPGKSSRWHGTPPMLLVEPSLPFDFPSCRRTRPLRVLAEQVSRVVRQPTGQERTKPGTLLYRNGRMLGFRSLRWEGEAVTVLTEDGIRRVALAEIVEVHLPRRDPWRQYYRQLAVLSPTGAERLIRLETADGLIATGSDGCFQASYYSDQTKPANWYHMIQPAWSLDPLWMPFESIRTRRCFAPFEVPLSRIPPLRSVQRSWLGGSWTWRADRNVQGGELQSAGKYFGWGFGVHAACELFFELPDCVEAFQSGAGIDRIAGDGGCVRALVVLEDSKRSTLFRSKHLVGSAEVAHTGVLKVAGPGGKSRRLVLIADAAHTGRPPGSDPFDVRDRLDWLEPMLLLDPQKLQAEIDKRIAGVIPAWRGWTVSVDGGGPAPVRLRWDDSDASRPRFVPTVISVKSNITLSIERQIAQTDRWLRIHLRQVGPYTSPGGKVEVRVDDKPIVRVDVARIGSDYPLLVPLETFAGRQVKLDVVFLRGAAGEQIDWRALAIVEGKTRVNWRPLEVVRASSQAGTTLTLLPDGSILAGGENPAAETYQIRAKTDLAEISAFRLEVLPDESLPGGGPGRSFYGNFVLSQFRVAKAARRAEPISGRYLRIELPGTQKVLNLAEVQVFRDEENIAIAGKATQSSTAEGRGARKAIDGNLSGDGTAGKTTQTDPEQADPWWELDLGGMHEIDRIVVWNRTDRMLGRRTANFNVSVLDADRNVTWTRERVADAPAPAMEFSRGDAQNVPIESAIADFRSPNASLDSGHQGWETASHAGRPHVAIFKPAEAVDARETGLVFTLRHCLAGHGLGRFRLLATGDPFPIPAEPLGVEVPLSDDGAPVSTPSSYGSAPRPPVLESGLQASVLVEVEGRSGSGVLVGNDAHVLTAGHVLAGSGKNATVTLADGRKLKAKTAGIFRDSDFGLLKILDDVELTGLELGKSDDLYPLGRYAQFYFYGQTGSPPSLQHPICEVEAVGIKTVRTNCHWGRDLKGGPMLDAAARVVGVHTGYAPQYGRFQVSKAYVLREHWPRLTRGEVWGEWLFGSGPMIGVVTTATGGGGRVTEVFPNSPAQKIGLKAGDFIVSIDGQRTNSYYESNQVLAGKDPGDEVTLEIRQGDKTQQKKIRLMPRVRKANESIWKQ